MRKRRLFITLLIMGVFAVVGLYFWFTRDIEAQENKLDNPEIISDQIFLIDGHQSDLNCLIESDISDIDGSFDIIGDRLEFLSDEESGEWQVILVLDIDGTSVDTGDGILDSSIEGAIKNGFDVAHHPIGRFVGTSDTMISKLEGDHTLNFVGQLELRGIVQDYTVPAHINVDGDTLIGSAEAEINVNDFGVDFPSAIASNILNADISVVATKSDEPIDHPTQTPSPHAE